MSIRSMRTTINDSIKQQIRAHYVIDSAAGLPPPAVRRTLAATPGISTTAARQGSARVYGATEQVNGIDPAMAARFYNFKWASGLGPDALSELDGTGALLSTKVASAHRLTIGSPSGS
jgi:hypothetical protein